MLAENEARFQESPFKVDHESESKSDIPLFQISIISSISIQWCPIVFFFFSVHEFCGGLRLVTLPVVAEI